MEESVHDSPGRCRVAMVASLFGPGTGQIYRCKNVEGLVWFAVVALAYVTNLALGAMTHALCVWHAGSAPTSTARGGLIKPERRPTA